MKYEELTKERRRLSEHTKVAVGERRNESRDSESSAQGKNQPNRYSPDRLGRSFFSLLFIDALNSPFS